MFADFLSSKYCNRRHEYSSYDDAAAAAVSFRHLPLVNIAVITAKGLSLSSDACKMRADIYLLTANVKVHAEGPFRVYSQSNQFFFIVPFVWSTLFE